jgi:hypothetical protein
MKLLDHGIHGPDGLVHRVEQWPGRPTILSMVCRPAYGFEPQKFPRADTSIAVNCVTCIVTAGAQGE